MRIAPWISLMLAVALTQAAETDSPEAIIAALQAQGRAEGWTFSVGENGATDRTIQELCGLVEPPGWRSSAQFDPCVVTRDLPASFDWREYDGCTPVRNQGSCGSCWAFGTAGALECNIKIRDGVTRDLSEQWLVSCNTDGYGCGGGWFVHDYHIWKKDPCNGTGYVLEADFPYAAQDLPCACPYAHQTPADGWAYIGSGSGTPAVNSIKQAILDYGPVSVAVYVNTAFHDYTGGIFNSNSPGSVNHAVVLVGWDDTQGAGGVWFLRNSWGAGWGEDGYMRIQYGCNSVGYAACYVNYPGLRVGFEYPEGRPDMLTPGQATTFPVIVSPSTGVPVPGTGQMHYSVNGGPFTTVSMTQTRDDTYQATIPAAGSLDRVQWFVSAHEQIAGAVTDPQFAPAQTYPSIVATSTVPLYADDFESNTGWTVSAGATTGNWERADPQQVYYSGTDEITQPEDDHTPGSALCYVTGAQAGSSAGSYDVDGGPTRLTSPVLNLTAAVHPVVSYWRWYHICTQWDDPLTVEVSNDNGTTWVVAEQIHTRQTWTEARWFVEDFVAPSAQVRIRFTAWDTDPGSLIEALVDDLLVVGYGCEGGLAPPDVTIAQDGLWVSLTWDPVPDATTYQVYSSADAWSGFVADLTGTLSGTTWQAPMVGERRYYRVTASSADAESVPGNVVGFDQFVTDIP
ncbi:hypothetical protein JXA88_19120 [Candidatus Fermentibacteria bacterium]|nr:hypothetical protein [Candidatus Fermentibacteria bacterium]